MGDTGKVYTFDDRSGIVYEVVQPDATTPRAYPRHILMEGDGDTNKGFKIEWATVKDGLLYTGSFGKEYTRADGSVENTNNMWVKTIDPQGRCVCLSVTPIARHPPHASHFWAAFAMLTGQTTMSSCGAVWDVTSLGTLHTSVVLLAVC